MKREKIIGGFTFSIKVPDGTEVEVLDVKDGTNFVSGTGYLVKIIALPEGAQKFEEFLVGNELWIDSKFIKE